uniref:nicotinamide/nicotinic acid mononucleotide adenylyltransferase 2-like n=1 Tax=Solea senegalensis TaxID=28829 RepID=UPI001CD909B5
MTETSKTHVILLSCGSFNPVTKGHVHMFEKARDYLHRSGRFIVIGGIISPVHDSYGKPGLVSSRHRLTMCQLAVQASDWIRVDPWECYQDTWQTTCSVLEHHRDLMKRVTGCILSNVNTPSSTPVIGQPQNQTPPIYHNQNSVNHKPTASKSSQFSHAHHRGQRSPHTITSTLTHLKRGWSLLTVNHTIASPSDLCCF